jgi:hypothetical protein
VTRDIRATPLSDDDEGLANNFRSVLNVNTSTNLYNAVQTEFGFVNKTMKIKAKYKRVEPDFQSMGAYYFQTDVENITLEPSFTLAKSKLRINSSIGQQRDNILHQKSFTSKRFIREFGRRLDARKILWHQRLVHQLFERPIQKR